MLAPLLKVSPDGVCGVLGVHGTVALFGKTDGDAGSDIGVPDGDASGFFEKRRRMLNLWPFFFACDGRLAAGDTMDWKVAGVRGVCRPDGVVDSMDGAAVTSICNSE